MLVHDFHMILQYSFHNLRYVTKFLRHTPKFSDGKFPIRWSALEVITQRIYSTKSDVWSFGIVMMETIQDGETPYKGK